MRVSTHRPPTLLHVTTVPQSLRFLSGQIEFMQAAGFDVVAATSPGGEPSEYGVDADVQVYRIRMQRRITPLRDLWTLVQLYKLMRRIRPDIVHSHTPKAGLLGTLAAWIARIPVRVYHLRGLPCLTAVGLETHHSGSFRKNCLPIGTPCPVRQPFDSPRGHCKTTLPPGQDPSHWPWQRQRRRRAGQIRATTVFGVEKSCDSRPIRNPCGRHSDWICRSAYCR